MKTSKKKTTTQKGKSTGRSKKTSATRKLNKNEMKGMAGGFNWSNLVPISMFIGGQLMEHIPPIIDASIKFSKKLK